MFNNDVIKRTKHPKLINKEEEILHPHLVKKVPVNKLSRIYGCDRKPIQTIIRNNGGELRSSTAPQIDGREEEIIKMYLIDQLTIQTIRKEICCAYGAIRNFLKRNNIKLRTHKESRKTEDGKKADRKTQKIHNIEDLTNIIKLYHARETLNILGDMYGISPAGLRIKLLKNGVILRTPTESMNLECVLERKRKTCMNNYGVENPMQHPLIYEKSNINRYKFKSCIINDRKFSRLQGYEPQAISYMIDTYGYDVYDIETSKLVPSIRYKLDNKNKVYHPDMYIPKDNLVVEVKCKYTYENDLYKNIAKRKSTIAKGFNFLTIIYTNKGDDIFEIMDSRI